MGRNSPTGESSAEHGVPNKKFSYGEKYEKN